MKKSKQVESLHIAQIVFKAWQFNKGTGGPLLEAEEKALTEWAAVSAQHKTLVERLAYPPEGKDTDSDKWFQERNKIYYFEHLVDYYFTNIHPEKIKRDNAIIWLMVDCWYKRVLEGREAETLQDWADSSYANRGIFERFKAHIEYIQSSAKNIARGTESAWKRYERRYLKSWPAVLKSLPIE